MNARQSKLKREQQRCADAINSAIYWRQCRDDCAQPWNPLQSTEHAPVDGVDGVGSCCTVCNNSVDQINKVSDEND